MLLSAVEVRQFYRYLDPANNKPVGSDRADPVLNLKISFDTAFDLSRFRFNLPILGKITTLFFRTNGTIISGVIVRIGVRQRPIRFRGKVQMWYYVPVRCKKYLSTV